tara:strand:+ start:570 stop:842 length:273 start_codon:yes stop_codon:yes gene_type:complete
MKKSEREYCRRVVELNCIACRKIGFYDTPAEIHHITNKTMGKKSSHQDIIPLCPYHHRLSNESIHLSPKTFISKFGTQKELLEQVKTMLG